MENLQGFYNELTDTLHHNILAFWLNRMEDHERGGFYGQMKGDGTLVKDAPRGAILYARILWTFSAAYRTTLRTEYFEAARRMRDYILRYFVDREYGGTFWEVDCEGRPSDTHKQFYAQAFMIYGLSEFVRAADIYVQKNDCPCSDIQREVDEAYAEAMSLYQIIERYSREPLYGGYIEACSRQWGTMEDMRLSELDENFPKSQNTHLHILEAYTNLLRVARPSDVESIKPNLKALIELFLDHILNPETHRLILFFQMDWTLGGHRKESYGHDIEFSWLLHESAMVLNDKALLTRVEKIVPLIAQGARKGILPDGSMIHEQDLDSDVHDSQRHWWVQAEMVVGYYRLYRYFGDKEALPLALSGWNYIRKNLIDNTMGEWHWSCGDDGCPDLSQDHAGFWKCPYHNTRMCLEVLYDD